MAEENEEVKNEETTEGTADTASDEGTSEEKSE